MRSVAISMGALCCVTGVLASSERYELLTGVNVGSYPGSARVVVPIPGPGAPGTFFDGDRLAGTSDDGPAIVFQGLGTPFLAPNNVGALSFLFKRGSVPIGGPNRLPFLGIDFLGGARLDLDGDPGNGVRSLVPSGLPPVLESGIGSFIELDFDPNNAAVSLVFADMTGTNEGAPGVSAGTATVVNVLAGTLNDGTPGGAINPGVDTRSGSATPFTGTGGTLSGVLRVQSLGYEIWQDSIDPGSSQASTLGTFQYLGALRGYRVRRDPSTLTFPSLAGQGLGSTLWPLVDVASLGQTFNTANGLAGGSATIAGGSGGDVFSAPNNGGVALASFGGDLGAYLDAVVAPLVPASAFAFVYLEDAGFGINNSGDPVFLDTIGYDAVIIAAAVCPFDLNGDGIIDQNDLNIVLAAFGTGNPAGDLNGDGIVDQSDLNLLLSVFGTQCD